MTLEYRCSNCGTLLQTTNADALDVEIELAHAERDAAEEVSRTAQACVGAMQGHLKILTTALIEAADRLEARGHKFGAREAWRILSDVGGSVDPS